jgi:AraC-like DNA-binding protein
MILTVAIAYGYIKDSQLKYAQRSYYLSLEKSMQNLDAMIEKIDDLATSLAASDWVSKIAYMQGGTLDPDRIDAYEMSIYVKQLRTTSVAAGLEAIGIIFVDKGIVVSSRAVHDFDNFVSHDISLTGGASAWNQTIREPYAHAFSGPGRLKLYTNYYDVIGYVQAIPLFVTKNSPTNLVVYIDLKSFRSILDVLLINPGTGIELVSQDGAVLYTAGIIDGDRDAVDINITSERTGWRCRLEVPRKTLNSELFALNLAAAMLAATLTMLALLISRYLSKRNSQPLIRLQSLISSANIGSREFEPEDKNIYYMLENSVEDILRQQKALNDYILTCKPQLKDYYLRMLISDDSDEQTLAALSLTDAMFDYSRYQCFVVSSSNAEMKPLLDAIHEYINDKPVLCYSLIYHSEFVLILNFDDDDISGRLLKNIEPLISKDPNGQKLYMGVGGIVESDIRISYSQALSALENRIVNSKQHVIIYDHFRSQEQRYHYPPEAEETLRNCILAGEQKGALEQLYDIVENNSTAGELSLPSARSLFFEIYFTISKAMIQRGIPNKTDMKRFYELRTLEDMTLCMESIISYACSHTESLQKDGGSALFNEIKKFVDASLDDSQLSLSKVSQHFNMSDSYVSCVFKEGIGMTFLEYVSLARIALSKVLLQQSTLDINEISRRIGYESDVTFRRVFKKIEKITPTQYRSLARRQM